MEGLRHARVAATWLHENKDVGLLKGSVTVPVILRQADDHISASISREISFGSTGTDLRDYLLFDFTDIDDILLFLRVVREGMQCAAHVCLNGQEYLQDVLDNMPI